MDTLEHFGVTQFSEAEIQIVCGIFDSNAFESTESSRVACRGLYLMSSLINSSCLPNTRHFFKVKYDEVYSSIIYHIYRMMVEWLLLPQDQFIQVWYFLISCIMHSILQKKYFQFRMAFIVHIRIWLMKYPVVGWVSIVSYLHKRTINIFLGKEINKELFNELKDQS